MKKIVVLCIFIFIVYTAFAQVGTPIIELENISGYENELMKLSIKIPDADKNDKLDIKLKPIEGEALEYSREYSYAFAYNVSSDSSEKSMYCNIHYVPISSGVLKLKAVVTDLNQNSVVLESEPVEIEVRPQPVYDIDDDPFLTVYMDNKEYYQGQAVLVSYELFNADTSQSLRNIFPDLTGINAEFLSAAKDRVLFNGNDPVIVKELPPAVLLFLKEGSYNIPEQHIEITFKDENDQTFNRILQYPSIPLSIKPLPEYKGKNKGYMLGSDVKIELQDYPLKVRYREQFYFTVIISGNINADSVKSLKPFLKIPSYLTEEIHTERTKIKNGEIFNTSTFVYSGESRSIFGLGSRKLELPFFNIKINEWEIQTFSLPSIKGNISFILILLIIIIAAAVIFSISIYITKNIKKKRAGEDEKPHKDLSHSDKEKLLFIEFVEKYSLTLREREILEQLSDGKSTKEIAELLFISPETTKKHIRNIMVKTETHSRYEIYVLLNKYMSKNG